MRSENSVYIASVVITYWFVSISMVYLNKILMTAPGISIDAPLFITWFQCLVTTFICFAAGKCGERATRSLSNAPSYTPVPQSDSTDKQNPSNNTNRYSFFAQFPLVEYQYKTARQIFPLSIIFVLMITFNNLCLKMVEVSFYNVARSLTIVFNVCFTYLMLGHKSSIRTMLCLALVILGFFLGVNGELNFSVKGTLSGVLSSLFVSLNAVFTKKVLPAVDDNHWRLTFYNNINATLLFIPPILYFESDILMFALHEQLSSGFFWIAMFVAGFFGFSIGIVTVMQIKATSPLSHNISGTAKSGVQSMMAFMLWKNEPTFMGVVGIYTVLGGSLIYTFVKMDESRQQHQQRLQQLQAGGGGGSLQMTVGNGAATQSMLNSNGESTPNATV